MWPLSRHCPVFGSFSLIEANTQPYGAVLSLLKRQEQLSKVSSLLLSIQTQVSGLINTKTYLQRNASVEGSHTISSSSTGQPMVRWSQRETIVRERENER